MDEIINDFSKIIDSEVSKEVEKERYSFCVDCPFFLPIYIGGEDRWTEKAVCDQCGCRVDYKTTRKNEHCPIGKW